MKLFKILSLFLLILVGLILIASFVLAVRLDVEYPQVGQVSPAELKELPHFIRYIFMFAITIAGLVAFASLVYGGFRYLTSAGSPAALSDAQSQITAGLLGLIILLASYLILRTINPQLTILKIEPTIARMGIILCKDKSCSPDILKKPNARSGEDYLVVKSNRPCLEPCEEGESGFYVGSIYFYESSDEVIVELYPFKDYKPEADPDWTSLNENFPGGTSVEVGKFAKSVKFIWISPGVYLFSTTNCDDPTAEVHLFGPGGVPSLTQINFEDKARAIKIIPRVKREKKWDAAKCPGVSIPPGVCVDRPDCCKTTETVTEKLGAVLFEDPNYKHSATVWLGGEPDDPKPQCIPFEGDNLKCYIDREPYCTENISKKASSIFVFRQAIKKPVNPSDWGDGVTVFEHAEWNEQEIEKFLDERKVPGKDEGPRYCGPINIGSPRAGGKIKPIFVDGTWTAADIGGDHPNLDYGTEVNCDFLFAEWAGGNPLRQGDGEEISSIKVAGNYLGLLLKKDGRGEIFKPPGSFNLKISHIGNDDADFLLVIPVQP